SAFLKRPPDQAQRGAHPVCEPVFCQFLGNDKRDPKPVLISRQRVIGRIYNRTVGDFSVRVVRALTPRDGPIDLQARAVYDAGNLMAMVHIEEKTANHPPWL